jgi:FG-GAP repeat
LLIGTKGWWQPRAAPNRWCEVIDLATDADVVIQGAAAGDFSGLSVSGAGDVDGDGIDDLIIGARSADPEGRDYAGISYEVFGTLDPAAALEGLIGDVQAAGLRPGIETSLTRRLENALRPLARGNTNAAIAMIGAFLNQVTALRGRQFPEAEADAWIAEAEAILAALAT